jgi:BirA family biotin operon repressor/biotin-[acetyl-CoA-carboxylase] ligase
VEAELPGTNGIDLAAVKVALKPAARRQIESLEHFATLDSTNRYLLESEPPAAGQMRVALAEYQQAGRGRRGRRWIMPPGAGIALSVSWQFAEAPRDFSALSLAAGAAASRAIRDTVGLAVGLKWPNDLMLDGGKLGGILVELDRHATGAWHVVAGIGINVRLPAELRGGLNDFRHGACDLAGALDGAGIDRARLAVALIERLVELFASFAGTGFAPYRGEWLAAHVLADRRIEIERSGTVDVGIVRGIDAEGALIVEDDTGTRRRVVSGDVTVRESA